MPIKINDIVLQEPVQLKLDYKPVLLYDSESVTGRLHRKYQPIKLFEGETEEKNDIRFEQDYKIELFNITKAHYQELKALDGTETTLHIQRGSSIIEPVPDYIAYYKFDGDTLDETENYNATNYGATLTEGVTGKANTAYYFDGNNANPKRIDTGARFNFTAFSLSCWIKLSAYTHSNIIVQGASFGGYNTSTDFAIACCDSGAKQIYTGVNDGSGANIRSDDLVLDIWYNVVMTWGVGVGRKLYIDGEFVGGNSTANAISFKNNLNCRIGAWDWSGWGSKYPFEGSIDNVRIYDRALSQEEITGIYQAEQLGIIGFDVDRKFNGKLSLISEKMGQHFDFDNVKLLFKVIEEVLPNAD